MRIRIICIMVALISALPGASQSIQEILFNRLSVRDGLPSNEITSLLKDQKGFIWVGTTSGLARFDGYEFKGFLPTGDKASAALRDGVRNLHEASDRKIWITCMDGSIEVFEPNTARFLSQEEILACLKTNNSPAYIFTDHERNVYYTTYEGGFYRYNPISGEVTAYPLDPQDGLVSSIGETNDRLYVIHVSGKIRGIDKTTLQVVFQDDFLTPFANSEPFYLFADSEGELWSYFNPNRSNGLYRLTPKTKQWKHYTTSSALPLSSSMVRDIQEDSQGFIWIATDHGGINRLDKKHETIQYIRNNPFEQNSLSENSVICLYRDDTDIMWAGTYKNGICYYHESIFKFQTTRYPLSHSTNTADNDYNCISEDKEGDLWIGTSGNGLVRYNRQSNTYTHFPAGTENENRVSGDVVISMTHDQRGNLWIGTYMKGLNCFDGKRFKHFYNNPGQKDGLNSNSIYCLHADKQDRLWIGTLYGGLNCLDLSTGKWSYYRSEDKANAINSNFVYTATSDALGKIWIGTSAGVNTIEPESGDVSAFTGTKDGKQAFKEQVINCIFHDSRQLMWIGSNQGLHIYDRQHDQLYDLRQQLNLPITSFMSIQEDENRAIWIGTKNGLLNITLQPDQEGNYQFNWNSYDENEGVQGRMFNVNSVARLQTGELAFGGVHGLTIVNPSLIRHNHHAPPAVVTGLSIKGTPIQTGLPFEDHIILNQDISDIKSLDLLYTERNFTLDISSCCYFLPQKNKYAFMLEGFDKKWTTIDASRRRITYTNLNPGEYKLLVKARNNDGVWSSELLQLPIRIQPPFWASTWAIGLYIFISIGLAYAIVRLLLHLQQKRLHEEQREALAQKQHELDEMKLRFFTNVSHEFRTPLTLILTPLEKLLQTETRTDTLQVLRLMQRNADQLLKLVNQLLDFRKIDVHGDTLIMSSGDIVAFIRDIAYSFKELSEQRLIHFSFSSMLTSLPMRFDTDKVFKIISNLLGNSFKFTPEGGTISIFLRLQTTAEGKNELIIEITDSGIGIPEEKLEVIFERFYQVDSPDSRNLAGTGIGLHLCREFVHLHGGTIAVKSKLGSGSTFRVTLPVTPIEQPDIISAPEQPKESAPPTTHEETEQAISEKPTLLIVDDNPDFREFMRLSLANDYTILTANDGEEAWQELLKQLPDMVISDVMMPVTDGITLCQRIKEDFRTSHIPVILLTAKSAKESQLSGLQAGADDYISKPFNMDMLLLKVRQLIKLRKHMQAKFLQSTTQGIPLAEVSVHSLDEELMRKAISYIEEQIENPELTVERLSREMGMSRVNFYKKCSTLTGKTPVELIRLIRLKRAAQLLEKSQMRINEIATACGFNDLKLFRKYFKDEYGMAPSDYQNTHKS